MCSKIQEGTRWFGKCWHYHNQLKYEFDVEFDIPVTYPMTRYFLMHSTVLCQYYFVFLVVMHHVSINSCINNNAPYSTRSCTVYIVQPSSSPEIALPELDGKTAKVANIAFLKGKTAKYH